MNQENAIRKGNNRAVSVIMIVIGLGVVGLLYAIYQQGAPAPTVSNPLKGRVMMVELTEEPSEGWDAEVFSKALESGGRVKITFKQIRSRYPEIETYVVGSSTGTYFTTGALINFITSKGWSYQGGNFGDLVFIHN